jgi:hydrogenase nickel incorporation protein HypA/HybF
MHEASLAQGLLSTALDAVQKYNRDRAGDRAGLIREISCELGLISSIEPESLSAAFELFAEGTLAEGARLNIVTAPLPCDCDGCGANFSLTRRHFVCPQCGGNELTFNGGHGLTLMSLNVESSFDPEENEHARTHSSHT